MTNTEHDPPEVDAKLFAPGSYASLPKALLADKTITPAAKIAYLGLQAHLSNGQRQAWPGPAALRRTTGLSRRTIQAAVDALVAKGWILRASGASRAKTNLYTLHPQRKDCASAKSAPPQRKDCATPSAKSAPKEHHERTPRKDSGAADKPPLEVLSDFPVLAQDPAFSKAWAEWIDYRRRIGKALKVEATARKQLKELADHGPAVGALMIDQAIGRGWQYPYPLKGDQPAAGPDAIGDLGPLPEETIEAIMGEVRDAS